MDDGRVDEWINLWMDGSMHLWIFDGWLEACLDGRIDDNGRMEGTIAGCIEALIQGCRMMGG